MNTSTRSIVVLMLMSLMVIPFAYKRPIDLLKVWLGVLTVAQLFQVYAIMQIRMPPSQAHEDMLVSPWTSTFGGNPVKEDLQMKTAGQQMGAKGDGTVINEKKWAQESGVQSDLTAILQ